MSHKLQILACTVDSCHLVQTSNVRVLNGVILTNKQILKILNFQSRLCLVAVNK